MNKININSPAKINLGLNVISKRTDGYHNIETFFYPLFELHDKLVFSKSEKTNFICNDINLPTDENNLIIKAKIVLENYIESKLNVNISLSKVIPYGAGLGGGSSNAAVTLLALNELFNLNISYNILNSLAANLGSDVSFFLKNKPAFGEGRGEILTYFDNIYFDYPILLIFPEIHISTKEAYQNIHPKLSSLDMKNIIGGSIREWRTQLKNDFEEFAFAKYPLLRKIKESLYSMNSIFSLMSGSGSSIYGIFEDLNAAKNAYKAFKDKFKSFLIMM